MTDAPGAPDRADALDHAHLFGFEAEFVDTLRCIPMAVRFKLDRVGIKLSLRQWSGLTETDRQALLEALCLTDQEIARYRAQLDRLVLATVGVAAVPLTEKLDLSWRDASRIPDQVADFSRSAGRSRPTSADWAGLSPLQRFALVKLSRDNHDNVNFLPALEEFGIRG